MKRSRHPWVPGARIPSALVALGLGIVVGLGCKVESVFTCLADEDCIAEGGDGGVCELNNLCTFPDLACASGKRWHDRAAELAGQCYAPEVAGTETDAGSGEGSGSGSTGGSGPASSTTLPADGSSSGEPPMTDTSAGSSSGGMPLGCDEQFGTVEGYQLCEETPDTCSFNAVLNQTSCNDLCPMFGSICITSFNNTAGDCASMDIEAPCEEVANDQICVCSR